MPPGHTSGNSYFLGPRRAWAGTVPLPLGALQQRALGQAAPMAGSRHRRPVAGVGHAASLCAAAAARGWAGVGAAGDGGARTSAAGRAPGAPRSRAGQGAPRAGGRRGGSARPGARREPRPGECGGGAWPGGAGRATRKRSRRTRVSASGRGVAMVEGGGAGRFQGRGRRGRGVVGAPGGEGGALLGPQASGAGRWRHFHKWERGILPIFPQRKSHHCPLPLSRRAKPFWVWHSRPTQASWPGSCWLHCLEFSVANPASLPWQPCRLLAGGP